MFNNTNKTFIIFVIATMNLSPLALVLIAGGPKEPLF
jgi:hypothetical protein